jgi:hypothetical protein
MMMCATTQRLITLLRILERDPAPFGILGDDAVLDAWFGIRSPWPDTHRAQIPIRTYLNPSPRDHGEAGAGRRD